jgi:hypothetical protein
LSRSDERGLRREATTLTERPSGADLIQDSTLRDPRRDSFAGPFPRWYKCALSALYFLVPERVSRFGDEIVLGHVDNSTRGET